MAEILKTEESALDSTNPSAMLPQVALRVTPQSQALTAAPATASTTVGGEGRDTKTNPLVQLYAPTPPLERITAHVSNKNNTTNSSRWTDTETRCLLELWRVNYRYLRGKKRNFQEWDLIAKEFNRRIGQCSLGPRTGNQCKIRIKNLSADYKKSRDQNQPFTYHDLMHELIENKDFSVDVDEATASDLFHLQASTSAPASEEPKPDTSIPPNVVTVHSTPGGSTPLNSVTAVDQATVSSNMHVTQPPMYVTQPPMHVTQPPMHVTQPPMHVTQQHMHVTQQPMHVTQPPMHVAQQPMHVTHQPMHIAQQPIHVTQQAEVTPHVRYLENSDDSSADESPLEVEYVVGKRSAMSSVYEPTPRKKPRKNPKPAKIVHTRYEEVSVMAIMREFLEDSRKREEDLFRQILQHQLQTERRYQDFTLEVVKEIGQLFKRD